MIMDTDAVHHPQEWAMRMMRCILTPSCYHMILYRDHVIDSPYA